MENEIWKDIPEYEGLYQVSNLGRVKSLKRLDKRNRIVKEKILKHGIDTNGYHLVKLYKYDKPRTLKVHRLICQVFIQNPNNYTEVNHKDEDKSNNCVDNLEWCTRKYNVNYGNRTNKAKNHPNCKHRLGVLGKDNPNSKIVIQYTKDGEFIKSWNCTHEVERKLGVRSSSVSACARGNIKSAGGFIWKYA